MSRWLRAATVLVVLAGLSRPAMAVENDPAKTVPGHGVSVLREFEQATVALFERASVSVVQIMAMAGGPSKTEIKAGSGFFWDSSGHIVTCAHIVKDAKEIVVWLLSGEQATAEVVGIAARFDLAVLRLKGSEGPTPPLAVGTSSSVRVGQFAFAIGSPFGLDLSLTSGVISALKRFLPTGKGRSITGIIQTDAAVHPGNSGGPLLNSSGEAIGVNTIAYSIPEVGTSFGFAIPIDLVKRVVPELIHKGRIPTPGIGIVPVGEDTALRAGVEGVMIAEIRSGSPAERARLQAKNAAKNADGDTIIAAGGQSVQNVYELTEQLEKLGVGALVRLKIKRGDQLFETDVEIIDVDPTS